MALTRRQREVLDVIRDFIASHGYSPSLEEIGSALGLSSVATVHKHVTHLVAKGLVRRVWNQNRSIEIVPDDERRETTVLPLAGVVAAGRPIEPVVASEGLAVPSELLAGRGAFFVLRAHGDSINDEQIRDGDQLLVEDRSVARDGETVVAVVDGAGAAVRRYYRDGASVRLQSTDPSKRPIVLPAERVEIRGVVAAVIRRY